MSQSVNGIFTNTFQPINEAEHQDLPPDSAEIQELENTIEQELEAQTPDQPQRRLRIVEDEVSSTRRQPPVWERMRGLKLHIPKPQRHQDDEATDNEAYHNWMEEFSNVQAVVANMDQKLENFKAEAEKLIKKSAFGSTLDDHGLTFPKCLPSVGANYPGLCDPAKLKDPSVKKQKRK